jgi:DNA polymerase-3 subunit delta'
MFDQIIIDEKNKYILSKAIDYNRVNHCYIFVGPEGTNKRKTAIEFSKAILCSVDNKPCNHCTSCNKMDSGNHPDFIEIFPLESSIKISQIREIQKKMNVKSYEGDKKVFIINNCETMGIPAQNSLLKTLEEPNAGVYIILISESKERILPTILSRGQILYFNPLDKETFKSSLRKKYSLKESLLDDVYELSQGCIEKAENIIKNPEEIDQFKIFRKYIFSIMKGDYSQIFEFSKWIKDEKLSNEYIINNLLILFKNALYAKVNGSLNVYKEISECLTYEGFHDIIGNIIILQGDLKYNVNLQLQIERLLLRIQEEKLINDKGHRNTV